MSMKYDTLVTIKSVWTTLAEGSDTETNFKGDKDPRKKFVLSKDNGTLSIDIMAIIAL
jgi:hypothetical protein